MFLFKKTSIICFISALLLPAMVVHAKGWDTFGGGIGNVSISAAGGGNSGGGGGNSGGGGGNSGDSGGQSNESIGANDSNVSGFSSNFSKHMTIGVVKRSTAD